MADKIDYKKDRRGRNRFPITHEKAVRDSNWVRLEEKLNGIAGGITGKQETLVSGENIKTIGGQSVLGAGNIPISDPDAVKKTAQTLTAAEKAQILANIGAASSAEVEALADQKYEGPYASASELPEASAQTMGAIYLVGPDSNDEYERKVTRLSNGSYSWASLGNTAIALANYASKESLNGLQAKLTDQLGYYQTDPDYIRAYTDKEGRFLFGIKTDGSIEWAIGIPTPVQEALADKVDAIVGKALIDEGFANAQSSEDNPEYLSVIIDSEGKMVANREKDGTLAENVGIKAPVVSIVGGKKDSNSSDAPTIKIGGTTISEEKDKESRTELLLDYEGRILSERRADGVKVESAGLSTPKLYLTGDGLSDLARDFRNIGLISNDWTDAPELHIPMPNFAVVNISGIETMPQTKTTDAKAVLQFWDMNGNYFKKEVIANAQGNSSLAHPKKNIAIDICNNNGWDDDDTFSLQIGDWVPQDSFHLKAYYNDPFRGLGAVGYDLYDEMCRSRGVLNDYVWKRALFDLEDVTATSTGEESGEDAEGQFFTGAKCFPKGFPVIIYLNGSFYGIFAWQLKKHRDNYHMKKNKAKQIHLDGSITNENLFNANGDALQIVWTTNSPEGIEVRNPKSLYCMDGTKYDADNNGGELIDATSPNYDAGKADHIMTAEVKSHILDLSRVKGIISTARTAYESSPKTDADLATFKSVFETYFDPDNLIDYLILSDVVNNYDGWAKNWQWLTYNGTKWYVMPYDLDGIFGNWWQLNDKIVSPLTGHTSSGFWTADIINYYGDSLNARYAELRNAGILDVKHIQGLCVSWLDRIGNKEMFDKEWEKWPGFIKNDSPMRLSKWIEESIANNDITYSFNQ